MSTLLLVIILLALLGALPNWNYSRDWGYGPSGVLGIVLVLLIIMALVPWRRTAEIKNRSLVGISAAIYDPRCRLVITGLRKRPSIISTRLAGFAGFARYGTCLSGRSTSSFR